MVLCHNTVLQVDIGCVCTQDLVAKKASQFTGFAQHDAQEFMAFLLDGLHEVCKAFYN